jgi:hypothetical protein
MMQYSLCAPLQANEDVVFTLLLPVDALGRGSLPVREGPASAITPHNVISRSAPRLNFSHALRACFT